MNHHKNETIKTTASPGDFVALPLAEWSAAEQEAWSLAKSPGNILDCVGPAADWSPHTQKKVELTVGRFLKWLLVTRPSNLLGVKGNIDAHTLRAYRSFLHDRVSSVSEHMYFKDLLGYCRVAWPDNDRSVLRNLELNLRWRAVPSRNKQEKMVSVTELLDLGLHLQSEGREQIGARPVHGAIRFRNGFLIRLLALRPLRIRAIGSLLIGQHIKQVGELWDIVAPSELSKTRQPWSGNFPEALLCDLDYYLNVARPILLANWKNSPTAFNRTRARTELWVGRNGQALPYKELSNVVARCTRQHFGVRIGPHMFRDCAATHVATQSGQNVGILKSLLGHTTLRTTERHYNQASQSDAALKYHDAMGFRASRPSVHKRQSKK